MGKKVMVATTSDENQKTLSFSLRTITWATPTFPERPKIMGTVGNVATDLRGKGKDRSARAHIPESN